MDSAIGYNDDLKVMMIGKIGGIMNSALILVYHMGNETYLNTWCNFVRTTATSWV